MRTLKATMTECKGATIIKLLPHKPTRLDEHISRLELATSRLGLVAVILAAWLVVSAAVLLVGCYY